MAVRSPAATGRTRRTRPGDPVSEGPATVLILTTTAAALAVCIRGVRTMLSRGEWDGPAWTAFLLAFLSTSFIDIVVTYTDQWTENRDAFGDVLVSLPGWADQVQRLLYVVIFISCVALVVLRVLRPGTLLNPPAVLFLLLALLSWASAALHGDNPVRPFSVIFLAVLAAASVTRPGVGIHVGLGTFCALAAVAAGGAAVLNPDFSTFACTADKCGLLGFNFRGWLDNENALAMYLTLAMPFVYVAFGPRSGMVLSTYVLFLVLLTGSRSGAVAAVVSYVLLLVVRPDIRRPRFSAVRVAVLYGALAVAGVVGVVLPVVADDPDGFTGRAYLWMLARSTLSDGFRLLLGSGSFGWQHLREAGLIGHSAVYSVHNQWLQVLFTTGVVGVVLLVTALALLIVQAGPRYALVLGCVLAPVMVLATTERPWPIDIIDWLVWALPGALLCCPVPGGGDGGRSPAGGCVGGSPGAGHPTQAEAEAPHPESASAARPDRRPDPGTTTVETS